MTPEKRNLLRIFACIDRMQPYQSPDGRCLFADDVLLDGKMAEEFNPQIKKLINDGEAFTCSEMYVTDTPSPKAYIIIQMNGNFTHRWRALAAAHLLNT